MKIVTIGGGTGQFHVLRALRHLKSMRKLSITAIPVTIDSGGSSGELRQQYRMVAPGDISQCIFGLHPDPHNAAWLFEHRFNGGQELNGHTARNIIVTAALQTHGQSQKAMDAMRDTFGLEGDIAPVTFSVCNLQALLNNGTHLKSEAEIYEHNLIEAGGLKKLWLDPEALPNPAAVAAIENAEVIIICPGTLVCSIVPNFLVQSIREALCKSKSLKIYVSNLVNRVGHVEKNWGVLDHVQYIESFLNEGFFTAVIANTQKLPILCSECCSEEMVAPSLASFHTTDRILVGVPLVMEMQPDVPEKRTNDTLAHLRATLHHDPVRLANAIHMVTANIQ